METNEWEMIFKLLDSAISMGLLLAAIMWFKSRDEKKDTEISNLNKELRESLEKNLNKTNDAIVNNTMALNAFREALRNV